MGNSSDHSLHPEPVVPKPGADGRVDDLALVAEIEEQIAALPDIGDLHETSCASVDENAASDESSGASSSDSCDQAAAVGGEVGAATSETRALDSALDAVVGQVEDIQGKLHALLTSTRR